MIRDKHINGMKCPLRGRTYDEDMIVDIKEFDISNSKDNIFVSEFQDRTFCIDDFIYLIVPGATFKSIIEDIYQKGIEAGRKSKQKRIEPEEHTVEPE